MAEEREGCVSVVVFCCVIFSILSECSPELVSKTVENVSLFFNRAIEYVSQCENIKNLLNSNKEEGICIFVSGWKTENVEYTSSESRIIRVLNTQYPTLNFKEVHRHPWTSYYQNDWGSYGPASQNTIQAGKELSLYIQNIPETQKRNIILIGHSLGCRVISNMLKLPENEHLQLKQIILFGAAVPSYDNEIATFASHSEKAVWSLIHPQDGALMFAVKAEPLAQKGELLNKSIESIFDVAVSASRPHTPMIGLGTHKEHEHFQEFLIANNKYEDTSMIGQLHMISVYTENHSFANFLSAWEKIVQNNGMAIINDILIPQDFPNVKTHVQDGKVWWNVVDTYRNWELQEHKLTHHRRILTPEDYRVSTGDAGRMQDAFNRIKQQIP